MKDHVRLRHLQMSELGRAQVSVLLPKSQCGFGALGVSVKLWMEETVIRSETPPGTFPGWAGVGAIALKSGASQTNDQGWGRAGARWLLLS